MRATPLTPGTIVACSLFLATVSGCLIAEFPSLETVAEATTDDSILGLWQAYGTAFCAAQNDPSDQWIEIRRTEDHYRLDVHTGEGTISESHEFELFQVGNRRYVEFEFDSHDSEGRPTVIAVLYWLEQGHDALRLRAISQEWLEDRFKLTNSFPVFAVNATPQEFYHALLEAPDSAFTAPDSVNWRRTASRPAQPLQETESSQ